MKIYNISAIFLLMLFISAGCKEVKWVKSNKADSEAILQEFLTDTTFNFLRNEKLIDNEEMAISVAEPYLFMKFKKNRITKQRPYSISLTNNGIWIISGTTHYEAGGTFAIAINSRNGEIIGISHGK